MRRKTISQKNEFCEKLIGRFRRGNHDPVVENFGHDPTNDSEEILPYVGSTLKIWNGFFTY
jgi:hypothetical protein